MAAGALVDAADEDGRTALYVAAENGHVAVVQALLQAGANVDAARTTDFWTPLHIAAENGHVAVVKTLQGAGADTDAALTDGTTPLHIAA